MQGHSSSPSRDESNIAASIRHRRGWRQAGRANFLLLLERLPVWRWLVLGLIASVALFSWVYRQEQRGERASFERRAQVRAMAVQQDMSNATDALQAVNLLFVANGGNVSREQFHTFAQALRASHPYIAAFAYDRLVTGDERPAFETQMRTRYPGFSITEMVDGKRVVSRLKDRYHVIDYMEPMTANEAALGLDVSSTPSREAAIRRADSTGLPAATGLFSPVQGLDAPRGFRILMTVYKGAATPDAAAPRQREVAGYTVAVLRADDLLEKIVGPADSIGNAGLDVRIYAAALADDKQLVYGLPGATTGKAQGLRPAWLFGDPAESFTHNFDVAGTPWHMAITARPTPFAAAHGGALAVLLASLLATLALTAYLQAIATRSQGIQQLVEQRTRELKQASGALGLSEARLRGIFDSATDAIITADESQTIVMANVAAAQMFRCPPGALIGAPLERFIPERHREMHRREVQVFGDTPAGARHMGGPRDVMGLRTDGQEFALDAAISHLIVDGRRLYTVILRDITERRSAEAAVRESEERLRHLLMLLPVGVFVYGGSGTHTRISFANEAAQRLVGTSEENLLGRSPLEFIHPGSLKQVKLCLLAMQGGTSSVPLRTMKIQRTDGAARLVETMAAPVTIAGKTSIVVSLNDVTELRRAQHALKCSHADLRRLVAAQDSVQDNERKRIARELHDDLQQTLAGLKMYLVASGEQLAQEPAHAAPLLAEAIKLTSAAIDSTRRIVSDLRPQVLDDLGLAPALEVLVGQFTQRTGIACYLEIQGEAGEEELESPAVASCLYRVAQEALTNVAKHAQASTVQVRLTSAVPGRLVLRISDNGSGGGISPKDRRKPGSFGLLGMHERVRALGGVLHIDSQPGSGTTLEVSLPVAPAVLGAS